MNARQQSVMNELMQMSSAIMKEAIPRLEVTQPEESDFFCYVLRTLFDLVEAWAQRGRRHEDLLELKLKWKNKMWNTKMSMRNGDRSGMMQGTSKDDTNPEIMKFTFEVPSRDTDLLTHKLPKNWVTRSKQRRSNGSNNPGSSDDASSTSSRN